MRHLKEPVEITVQAKTSTAATIRQRYWMVSGLHKLDALTRILEGETFDAMIVFVRTKHAAEELAEKLEARGFASAPLNGDIPQNQREAPVEKLREGTLDILVATDVAARGLDVSRISHVINYDIPNDTESYVHRIGRTGRAGRSGEAILFVAPREKRLLHAIEKATNQKIDLMQLPSTESINDARVTRFKQRITDTLAEEELGVFYQLVEEFQQEHNVPALEIAAALARLLQGDSPLLLNKEVAPPPFAERERDRDKDFSPPSKGSKGPRPDSEDAPAMRTYRLDVGEFNQAKTGQIVGAIANEAGIHGSLIRRITIHENYSTVDLPADLPAQVLKTIARARVAGRPLSIEFFEGHSGFSSKPSGFHGPKKFKTRKTFSDKKQRS
jgi:ATP-dependent RNA helicase DeaD